jgi:hypothetical protein
MMEFLMKINYLTNLKTLTTPLYTTSSPTGAHWKTRNQNTEKEVSNRLRKTMANLNQDLGRRNMVSKPSLGKALRPMKGSH